jgi:hypothetical protein
VKIVQMYREGRHYTVISTDLDLNPAQIRRRMRKRWWCEEVTKRLKGPINVAGRRAWSDGWSG